MNDQNVFGGEKGIRWENGKLILSPEYREKLKPNWIPPESIMEEPITFRAVVELNLPPVLYKGVEDENGETEFSPNYPKPKRLCEQISMDWDILKYSGDWEEGIYGFQSLEKYTHQDTAKEVSEKIWRTSKIVKQYKKNKICNASYGIEEVETGYTSILGYCDKSDRPFWIALSREDHINNLSVILSVINALDTDAYRVIDYSPIDDEHTILKDMHKRRIQAPFISSEKKKESLTWLRQHQ